MGFYAPAQLVRDAREHGVKVLPVDVRFSEWETVLVLGDEEGIDAARRLYPVRLGLGRISGLPEEAAQRIVRSRTDDGAFTTVEDLARRADLNAHDLRVLAEADALQGLSGHRHQAAGAVAGVGTRPPQVLR